ncbi:MAG: 50S ribosomal protein L6 [Deltaproteobacteria bacterium]|nr:50S ribosomal protein L6 [Deltaproteobacteria bacterium]
MSRVGKQPVVIPKGVTVSVSSDTVTVKGPKGELQQVIPSLVSAAVEGGEVVISRADDSRDARARHGLVRALVRNMVVGVTTGFEKKLEIQGVGFRAEVKGKTLVMNLGYSHPVEYPIPAGISIAVEKNVNLSVQGIDRQRVGQVAAVIRKFREPDHYKGKGVRYVGEYVRIKTGKSA